MRTRPRLAILSALLLITALGAGLRFYHIDRLPPGLHYDEAFNDLEALRVVRDGTWPIFFTENFGQEPLHIYLIALLFHLIGPVVPGGRLVSALAGTATVPLLFFAVQEIFQEEMGRRRAARLGLIAALSLALLYWHVHYSRIGMEPNMVPMLAVATLGLTWRALRTQKPREAVIAGVLLGGSLYTYASGRFVPLVLALFFGLRGLLERDFIRVHYRTLMIVAATAALVFVPLGYFFASHPYWFTLRASHVVHSGSLLEGFAKVVGGLFFRGDLNPRQNLPGRPALDPIQAILFILGLGMCVSRRRPPHMFLICWLGVMLLPSALTEYPPHFGRMLGAAPAAAALAGLGAVASHDLIMATATRWLPQARRAVSTGVVLLLVLALTLSGVCTVRDYFLVWRQSDDLFIAFDVGLRWIGEYVAALPQEEQVYVSPIDRFHTTLKFLLDDDPYRTHNYNGRRCVVYPSVTETSTTHVIIVFEDPDSLPTLQAAFPDGQVVQELYMGDTLYSVVYHTPAGSTAQIGPAHSLEADFDGQIWLTGYDPPAGPLAPGDTISLRLYWLAQTQMTDWYKVFVHLWSTPSPAEGGRIWGQEDVHPCDNSYHTPWWAVGDIVADEYRVPISPDTPPGEYQLVVGLFLEDGPRLPVLDTAGEPIGDHVVVTTVQVVAP